MEGPLRRRLPPGHSVVAVLAAPHVAEPLKDPVLTVLFVRVDPLAHPLVAPSEDRIAVARLRAHIAVAPMADFTAAVRLEDRMVAMSVAAKSRRSLALLWLMQCRL